MKIGKWIFKERTELVSTGETRIVEDSYLRPPNKKAIMLKKHIKVRKPFCSECNWHEDNEFEATPYCPNCGAKMLSGGDTIEISERR